MKKLLLGTLILLSVCAGSFALYARHGHHGHGGGGGDAFVGGLAGGMVGGVVSGAMTKDSGSSKPSRAEIEARRAQDQAAQLAREQEQQRYMSLQQQMYQKPASELGTVNIVLIIALVLLFIAVLGMGMMFFRMKNK